MANQEKGEAPLTINGVNYTLVRNYHAIALYQAEFSKNGHVADLNDLDQQLREGSLLHIATMFWAMLQKYHAGTIRTVAQASELIDTDAEAFGLAMRAGMGLSAPDPEDVKELDKAVGGNPPAAQPKPKRKPRRGNGAVFSSMRAASV